MHKHLLNRVQVDPPKDKNPELYLKLLEQKNAEFQQYVIKEIEKIMKQKKDSQALKELTCKQIQQLFSKNLDILHGKNPPFDFEVAVKALRSECKFFGAPREHVSVSKEQKWPYFEAFRNKALTIED